jgi:hypothetical protein
MKHSAYEGAPNIPAERALGYEAGPNGYRPAAPVSVTQMYAAGALVSTVDDLARWDAAVSSGKLLKAATWQRAFTNYRLANGAATGYGYGWEIGKLRGVDKLSHGGRTNGFQSYAMRLPAEKVYVAVLSNGDSGVVRPDFTAFKAAAAAIGKPLPEYKAVTLDAALLDTYAGVYKVDDKAKRSFKHVKDTLVMQRTGGQPMPLTAFSQTGFFVPNSMTWVEFKRDAKGEVSQAVIHDDEDDTANANERIGAIEVRKPVTIAHSAFDAHAGRYQLGPMVIEVTRDGDHFFVQPAGQKKLELFALSEDKFFATALEVDVSFDTGPNSEQLTLSQNGREMKGKKLQ